MKEAWKRISFIISKEKSSKTRVFLNFVKTKMCQILILHFFKVKEA